MQVIPGRFGPWVSMAAGLLVALCLSTILRPATARLNQTLGMVWPFSTVHCETQSAPGCEHETAVSRVRIGFAWR